MEKTFFSAFGTGKKFFYYLLLSLMAAAAIYFNGCTSAVPEDPAIKRAKDSLSVYKIINGAFAEYKTALDYNQKQQPEKAKSTFEDALQTLKKVNVRLIDDTSNVKWKNDFISLAKSISQDYLYTQTDIPQNSLVFKFAKKYGVGYDVISLNSGVTNDVEPLPDGTEVPLIKNSAVDEYIDFFSKTDRGKSFIDKTLYRSGKYFPIMRKILRYHNAPEEMIYLSVQESGLNPTIVSRAGAVGLWQFMPTTGKAYGLYQDSYRDDRRDVEKSTDAAARHLKDLYRSFGDWYLAWAAYNAGAGRITNALNKNNTKDFWEIRSSLPGETKNYVPSIIALSFIFRDPPSYGFKDVEYGKPLAFDRINISGELSLDKVAQFSESDIETIRELNSELTSDVVPKYDVPYQLRIPQGTYKTFTKNYKNSSDYKDNGSVDPEFAGNEQQSYYSTAISVTTYAVNNYDPGDQRYVVTTHNKQKLDYTYPAGKNLAYIADSFKVRESDIRYWNNLAWGSAPAPNQQLSIYFTDRQYKTFYGIKDEVKKDTEVKDKKDSDTEIRTDYGKKDNENKTEKKETGKKDTGKKDTGNKEKTEKKKNNNDEKVTKKKAPEGKEQTYTVKEGDYLSTIAEKYGVKTNDIREWNDIQGDKILVGQKLTIYSDKKVTEKKEKTNKNKTEYTVEEGDNLSAIADDFGVTVEDLKDWNDLDSDVIYVGQKLAVVEPKTTKEKKTTSNSKKGKIHKVKEGENLTLIADKYDVSVEDLKDWNDLEKDVIVPGQELIVSKPSKTTKKTEKTTEKETKNKTYKVKKGDKLSTIADNNDLTVKQLIKWNDLDSDGTIYAGQVLKLYDDTKGTDTKKKKKN
ncbi:MAG: LysM peptidoglycan-binding domain-containing protein [Bacteroidetes bacterium]|nr:LysM peptidoglycan-binding domain-containing protein [Bacteroidota bacterium]